MADKRAALIAGLRALADFYETHPDMPLPYAPDFTHCVLADDDAAGIAEVTLIAEQLGVEMTTSGGSANADRRFEGLRFRSYYVSRQRAADWRALVSYDSNLSAQSGR